jgi:hypothetical protein
VLTIERSSFEEWNKVKTEDELHKELWQYKDILSSPMLEYLDDLISSHYSAINDYISDDKKKLLGSFPIYRDIVKYNIYTRALEIFKESNRRLDIADNSCGWEGIKVMSGKTGYARDLFEYNYAEDKESTIPSICGVINIYQYKHDEERKQQEIERLKEIISNHEYRDGMVTFDGSASIYDPQYDYMKSIKNKRDLSVLLNSELTKRDKRIIEISKEFNDLLLEDYELNENDFGKNNFEESKVLEKYRKVTPNIKIYRTVHYI